MGRAHLSQVIMITEIPLKGCATPYILVGLHLEKDERNLRVRYPECASQYASRADSASLAGKHLKSEKCTNEQANALSASPPDTR